MFTCTRCQSEKPGCDFYYSRGVRKNWCRGCTSAQQKEARVAARNATIDVDKFWPKVSKSGHVPVHRAELGPCWVWVSKSKSAHGYGLITIHRRTFVAHRVSYCIEHGLTLGQIDGLVIMHQCDNPACVNPAHLSSGTMSDNTMDMVRKGRARNGKSHRLSEELVKEIRAAYANGEGNTNTLGKRFGVNPGSVWFIVKGIQWRHV